MTKLKIKWWIYNWIGIILVIWLSWIAYWAYVSMSDVTTGQPLTASTFNQVLENIRVLKTTVDLKDTIPTWTVSAFSLPTCPTGRIPANGTSGTPDLRWEFIRWLDSGRWVDIGRVLASPQLDSLQWHHHYITSQSSWADNIVAFWATNPDSRYATAWDTWGMWDVYFYVWNPKSDWSNWTPRTASETRPRNVALLYCVKQ